MYTLELEVEKYIILSNRSLRGFIFKSRNIAHEVTHIVKSHVIASATARWFTEMSFESLRDLLGELAGSKTIGEFIVKLLLFIGLYSMLMQFLKFEAIIVKKSRS